MCLTANELSYIPHKFLLLGYSTRVRTSTYLLMHTIKGGSGSKVVFWVARFKTAHSCTHWLIKTTYVPVFVEPCPACEYPACEHHSSHNYV